MGCRRVRWCNASRERNNNKTSSCPDCLMATAKIKDQPHFVGTHFTTSAIKPSLGLDSFPTTWEQLQTTITVPPAPTTSDSLSQQSCHAQKGWKREEHRATGRGCLSRAAITAHSGPRQGRSKAKCRAQTPLSGTYTFLSLSNIPFMVSMARVAASCVSKWTKP